MEKLIYEKMITPSSPTPKDHKHYKLSFLDQLLTSKYFPVTLFYHANSTHAFSCSTPTPLSSILEKSLSKLLSFYYPYAGKLVGNAHVDCNDRGVALKEVRVKGSMSDTLNKEFSRVQGTLFPAHALPWTEPNEGDDNLATVVQLTHFDCGGLAISLCLQHKLADGYTISKFLSDWGQIARNSTFLANPPLLTGSSLLPPKDDPFTANFYEVANKRHLNVVRLRFNPDNINRLQDIVSSESNVKDPTRFEVVAAAVNICAATPAALNTNSSSPSFNPFTIYIPMNIRKLVNPPVPNLVGNFLSFILVNVLDEGDLKLPILVSKIRKEKIKNREKYQGKNKDEVLVEMMDEARVFPVDMNNNLRLTTSLCRYPLYDVDFGWGKPERVTVGAIRDDNYFVLLDAPDMHGVDVIAALDQTVALQFKNHKELLQFASIDLCY